jgi:cell division septation protein DedD
MADNFRVDRARGPIAELARLISEVHGERAHADGDFGEETASVGYDNEPPQLPPAPQLPADLNGPEQAFELDEHLYDDEAQDVDNQRCTADEEDQNEVPRMRRRSLTLVVAITGLALVGTAGALGYRGIFGGSALPNPPPNINVSNEPNTIAPASSQLQAKSSGNESQVGAETTGSIENTLSHREQSVTHSAAPIALTNATSTAAATPPALGGGYTVQVTSERTEIRAQAAFRALQAKYPNQLNGRQAIIRRADLGATGIYYRALVGPFGSAEKAAKLCSGLKAAGGDCIILKN